MKFQNEKKELWRYASKNLEAPVRGTSKQPPLPHHLPPQRLPQSLERPMTTQSSQLALLGCYGGYGENSISTATIFGEGIVCTPPPPYSSASELDCSNSVTIPDYTLTLRKHPAYYKKEKGMEASLSATESDMGYSRKIAAINRDGCRYANTGDIMYADDHNKLNESSTSSSSQLTFELQMKARQSSPHSTIQPQPNQQMTSTATIAAPTATITTSTTSFAATAAKILRNCCGGTFGSSNSFAIPPTNSCNNNNNTFNKTIYHHPKNGVGVHTANSCNFPPEQHFNTLMKQLKASQISSLLKAVKSRHDQILPMPTPVSISSSNASTSSSSLRYSNHLTNCILVRRAEILGEEPYVIACRLFFWRDLKNASQIKRLPVCPNERDPVYVCCNPLHWCRILDTGENSVNDVNSSTDRDKIGKYSTDVQRQTSELASDSVTTDGEDRRSSSNWCEVAYWEMGKRVGERYLADTPAINIFSDKSYTTCGDLKDGMCLRDLVEKSATFSPDDVQHTRQKIGLGVTLSHEWDGVWLYNRSTVPVFLYSPTLTESWFRVSRLEPGDCLKAFDQYKANSLIYPSQFPGVQAGPIDKFSMCISFGKGWGYSYKRPNITLCPCWLEVFFKPQR